MAAFSVDFCSSFGLQSQSSLQGSEGLAGYGQFGQFEAKYSSRKWGTCESRSQEWNLEWMGKDHHKFSCTPLLASCTSRYPCSPTESGQMHCRVGQGLRVCRKQRATSIWFAVHVNLKVQEGICRPLNSQYLVVTFNISNTISISHYRLPFSQYFNPILTTGTLFLNISILQATPTLEKNFHQYPHMFKEAHGNFSVLVKYKLAADQ